MIKDRLDNFETYNSLSNNLRIGFEWLKNNDLKSSADGKYIINDNAYANIQSYNTKIEAPFEAHRKYIDIQYMINGEERIDVTNYKNCKTTIDYDKEKDIEFLDCTEKADIQLLHAGEFLVLFPQDAHKPSLNLDKEQFVKKVVVKILYK